MVQDIDCVCHIIKQMDSQLRTELLIKEGEIQEKKLWENTYICHQIARRERQEDFSMSDHIRAMVYAMLSSGISWERVEKGIDKDTGKNAYIDNIFYQYNPYYLLSSSPDVLTSEIKKLKCASQSTRKQMEALVYINIPKMIQIEEHYGHIDKYYEMIVNGQVIWKTLVKALSKENSKDKYAQMGEALIAEYLRNVGYDMAKPDRHIRRILGCKYLGCSEHENVPVDEAFEIIEEIADRMNEPAAYVDYILWSYCAKGFGEVCTVKKPKCDLCVFFSACKRHQ